MNDEELKEVVELIADGHKWRDLHRARMVLGFSFGFAAHLVLDLILKTNFS